MQACFEDEKEKVDSDFQIVGFNLSFGKTNLAN